MKKILLIMLLFIPTYVLAYENDYFSIEIPEGYKDLEEGENIYTWKSDTLNELPSIIITTDSNSTTSKQDINNFSDEDLEKYKKQITETLNKSLTDYNLTVNVTSMEKEKINNYLCLTYVTEWPTEESLGYIMYQKSYVITTNSHITTVVYTTDSKEEINDTTIFKNFKINDKEVEKEGFFANRINQIIITGVVAGIIGYIISCIKNKKSKN